MVTRLSTGKHISGAIHYNEVKVSESKAELLLANHFLKKKEDLNFKDKVKYFQSYTERNIKSRTNSFHFSLNFHEKDILSQRQLKDIAGKFMQAIGFGKQPYLVYQHFDAGHPHLHIVSTNIQLDGKRIKDNRIADHMRKAATEIEKMYGITLTGKNLKEQQYQYPEHDKFIAPLNYPDKNLRKTVSDIIHEVYHHFRYKSFDDFNKLLIFYNMKAIKLEHKERVGEEGETYGIMFRALKKGKEIGTPVYGSELLYTEGFTFEKLEIKIAQHRKAYLSRNIEQQTNEFLKDRITYTSKSLHTYLQDCGFMEIDRTSGRYLYLDIRHKTVVGLEDIKDEALKKQLSQKESPFDLSKTDAKEINSTLTAYWQQIKKGKQEPYYLESRMKKDLARISFGPVIQTLKTKFSDDQINFGLEAFISYKKAKLSEIEDKEKSYFLTHCQKVFTYLSHVPETVKKTILQRMGICYENHKSHVSFQHTLYPELHGTIKGDEAKTKQAVFLGDGAKEIKIGKSDLAMLSFYLLSKKSKKGIESLVTEAVQKLRLPCGYQYLKSSDQIDFLCKFTEVYLKTCRWNSEFSAQSLIANLAGKGILIKPDAEKGTYSLGIHGFPDVSYRKASDRLNALLKQADYQEKSYQATSQILESYYQQHHRVGEEGIPRSVLWLSSKEYEKVRFSAIDQKVNQSMNLIQIKPDTNYVAYDDAPYKKKKKKINIL